jgi:hypothetical protein
MPTDQQRERVITMDGQRARQTPIAVVHAGERLDITAIEHSWIATGVETTAPVRRGFEVRCRGGARFRLVLTEGAGWAIEPIPGPRLVPEPDVP